MPDPTTRDVPKGQAQGAVKEQQQFEQESAEVAGDVVEPTFGGGPAIEPNAVDVGFEEDEGPDDEEEVPNVVELEDGVVDLDEVLFAGSERPAEAVLRGVPGAEPARTMSQLYDEIVERGVASPDVVALADMARMLGL